MLNKKSVLGIISNQIIFFFPSEVKWYCVDFRGCKGAKGGGGGVEKEDYSYVVYLVCIYLLGGYMSA